MLVDLQVHYTAIDFFAIVEKFNNITAKFIAL